MESRGSVRFLCQDFFELDNVNEFDLVFDCMFLFALHPNVRQKWATKIYQVLKPGGELVTLIYPINNKPYDVPADPIERACLGKALSVDLLRELLLRDGRFELVSLQDPLPPELQHVTDDPREPDSA